MCLASIDLLVALPSMPCNSSKSSPTDPGDQQWLSDCAQMFRSQTAYLFSDWIKAADLADRAAEVMTWRQGRFICVRELVDQCAAHEWNGTIYEAWVWETACRVRALIRSLDAISARAAKAYAQHLDYYEADWSLAREAINDALAAMEGTLRWED